MSIKTAELINDEKQRTEQFLIAKRRIEEKRAEKKGLHNEMEMTFAAISSNEAFARVAVAAFVSPLNPTLEEISDIKTAVSEAVTNAIIHGYDEEYQKAVPAIRGNKVKLSCLLEGDVLHVEVRDEGKGIENIKQAMEPLFTTKPQLDRSGMGFAFMEAFMDDLEVISRPGFGTTVLMKKKMRTSPWVKLNEEER